MCHSGSSLSHTVEIKTKKKKVIWLQMKELIAIKNSS